MSPNNLLDLIRLIIFESFNFIIYFFNFFIQFLNKQVFFFILNDNMIILFLKQARLIYILEIRHLFRCNLSEFQYLYAPPTFIELLPNY